MIARPGSHSPRVVNVSFTPAPPEDVQAGLLGFVAATVNGLHIAGIALRRTRAGRFDLRYPERRGTRHGRAYAVVRPSDEATRKAIESQVFAVLRAQGVLR